MRGLDRLLRVGLEQRHDVRHHGPNADRHLCAAELDGPRRGIELDQASRDRYARRNDDGDRQHHAHHGRRRLLGLERLHPNRHVPDRDLHRRKPGRVHAERSVSRRDLRHGDGPVLEPECSRWNGLRRRQLLHVRRDVHRRRLRRRSSGSSHRHRERAVRLRQVDVALGFGSQFTDVRHPPRRDRSAPRRPRRWG